MVSDQRGVLWMLLSSGVMYTFDPDRYLSPLHNSPISVESFALDSNGEWENPLTGFLYFAAGRQGLACMDRTNRVSFPLTGENFSLVHVGSSGRVYAGSDRGLHIKPQENGQTDSPIGGMAWKKATLKGAQDLRSPSLLAEGEDGILCLNFDGQLYWVSRDGETGYRMSFPEPGEAEVNGFVETPQGDIMVLSGEGIYIYREGSLSPFFISDEPLTCAVALDEEKVLVGTRSGRLLAVSIQSAEEQELASLEGEINLITVSPKREVFVCVGNNLFISDDMFFQTSRISKQASWEIHVESGGKVDFSVLLPSSHRSQPLWYYLKLEADAPLGETPEILPQSDKMIVFKFGGGFSTLAISLFAIGEPKAAPTLEPEASHVYPSSFPEEIKPYLQLNQGAFPDLPELQPIVLALLAEGGGDMEELLQRAVREKSCFYQAPYRPSQTLPLPQGHPNAASSAREAIRRVLRGEGGDDFSRALAFTCLGRKLGIPTRMVVSGDHFYNEVFLETQGWLSVDVSYPIYDFLAPGYPTFQRAGKGSDALITGIGDASDYPREIAWSSLEKDSFPSVKLVGFNHVDFQATYYLCKPSSYRIRDVSEMLPINDSVFIYFYESGGEIFLIRRSDGKEKSLPIHENKTFSLDDNINIEVKLLHGKYVWLKCLNK